MIDPPPPFAINDPERRAIWQMLVVRDTDAFCAGDWSRVAADFDEESFLGIQGGPSPEDWRPTFSSLSLYRDAWLEQSKCYRGLTLSGETVPEFLLRSSRIKRVDIQHDRAIVLKVIEGRASDLQGEVLNLSWQTVYILRKREGNWKITGFVGYLPYSDVRIRRPESRPHSTAGPYSPVLTVDAGPIVAISGQGPIDGEGRIVGATIKEQTRLTLENCRRQLSAVGSDLRDVFKVNVYLKDMAEWDQFNVEYREFFSEPFPVRTAIQAVLWGGILVEVEMLAAPRPRSAAT